MELNHFTLVDGTLDVSKTTLFITDSAQKRRSSFLLLCIVSPILAGLMAWSAYNDGNPLLTGIGLIVLVGFLVLIIINRHQLKTVDNLILLENIKSADFHHGKKKKSTTVTLYLKGKKLRQIGVLQTGNQVDNLRRIFTETGIPIKS